MCRREKPKSAFFNDRGIALPLVLMLMIVLSILGIAAYTASQSSLKQAARLNPTLQCKYLARSATDATISAWTDSWLDDPANVPTSEHFYSRYDTSTDDFVHVEDADKDDDGVIETTQTYNSTTGICTITSTAKIGTYSATVRAVSEPVNDVTTTTSVWVKDNTIQPNSDASYNYSESENGYTYYSSYHYNGGVVTVNVDKPKLGKTLYLDNATRYNGHRVNLIGFQAKKIIYNCPLDLYWRTFHLFPGYERVYSHVITAEHILFRHDITIGDGRYGGLILNLPDGKGIPGQVVYQKVKANKVDREKVVLNAKYGIVKFAKVNVEGSINDEANDDTNIRNKTFYFREPSGEKSLIIGMEPHALSELADWLGITDTNRDYRLESLLEKGLLIEAPNNGIGNNVEDDFEIRFIYE